MPKKGKKLEEKKVEQYMNAYTEATADALLNEAFGRFDGSYDSSDRIPYLDRADHIIIGGQTASQLLVERFNEELPSMKGPSGRPYDDWERTRAYSAFYQEKAKGYINQMVAEAINRGEKVEVYVPDKATGQIEKTPMKLTHSGYEPSGPLAKPAQMNRWQRFWNKFGFYKKEKAAIVNYEKETAARNRVQFCNKTSRASLTTNYALTRTYLSEMEKYQPDMAKDLRQNFPLAEGNPAHMGDAGGFKTVRSSFMSTAICVLATKRDPNTGKLLYTNEQLFDMHDPKMQKARADAMREVYDHYKPAALLKKEQEKQAEAAKRGETYTIDPKIEKAAAESLDWLVDVQHDASGVLRTRIDDQAKKLDFSKTDLTEQKGYKEFALLSDTAFDQSQDMIATKVRMDEKYGNGTYWAAAGKLGDGSQLSREVSKALLAQRSLVNGVPGSNESIICSKFTTVFKTQTLQQQIGKALAEDPSKNYSDVMNENLLLQSNEVSKQTQYDDEQVREYRQGGEKLPVLMEQNLNLAQEYKANPEQFSRQIQSGVFENRLKLQELNEYGAEVPGRFEIRNAQTAQRELEQAQQVKTSGEPVL